MKQPCPLEEALSEHLLWNQARIKFLAYFIEALLKVKTVNLTQVATAICGNACVDSKYKRVRRFLRHMIIDQGFIALIAVNILPVGKKNWVLTLDRTNWKFGKFHINILVLGLAYQGMAIP